MPEVSNKAVRPVSSGKKDADKKLLKTKQKILDAKDKGKTSEKGTVSALKKSKIPTKEISTEATTKEETGKTLSETTEEQHSSTSIELKPKPTIAEQNQNGKIPSSEKDNTDTKDEPQKEPKRVSKKDSEKKVLLPKQLSVENPSERDSAEVAVHSSHVSVPIEKQRTFVINNDSWIMSNIPYLPLGLAVVFLILNIIIPGLGTILSGFSILCCGKCRVQTKDDQRLVTLCVNACVGVSQLFTVTFLLVGWFWSIAWGVNMVLLAVDLRRQKKEQREREIQTSVLNAFGNSVPMRNLFPGIK